MVNKVHPSFEKLLEDFTSGKTLGPHLTNFFPYQRSWLKQTAKSLIPVLRDLYKKWNISPAPILFILAYTEDGIDQNHKLGETGKAYNQLGMIGADPRSAARNAIVAKKLLSRLDGPHQQDRRAADLKVIEGCLAVVNVWRAASSRKYWANQAGGENYEANAILAEFKFDDLTNELKRLRCAIERIHDSTGRPRDLVMRDCARNLAVFFQTITKNPLYQRIGEIMRLSFPAHWARASWRGILTAEQQASRDKETARKIIGKIPDKHYVIAKEAVSLQNGDPDRMSYWTQQHSELRSAIRQEDERLRDPKVKKHLKALKREADKILKIPA